MVTSSAVVGSSAMRSLGRHDNAIAIIARLPHSARERMRVVLHPALRIGDPDSLEHFDRRGPGLLARRTAVGAHGFGDLVPDGERGVEARHRFLEDHCDLAAAHGSHLLLRTALQVTAFELDPARRHPTRPRRQQPHQRERGHRLARTALADERDDLAGLYVERGILDDGLPSVRRAGELDLSARRLRAARSYDLLDHEDLAPERVAQAVADQVHGKDRDRDRETRREERPLARQDAVVPVGQHRSPTRR